MAVQQLSSRRVASTPVPSETGEPRASEELPPPPTELQRARRPLPHEQLSLRTRLAEGSSALADGAFRVGPKHTWHAIKVKPTRYAVLLGGLGAAGAGLMAAGVNPAPYTIGFSALVFGWATYQALPDIRAYEGTDRMRSIGANVVWPAALCVGTAVGGHPLGPDGALANPTIVDLVHAGAQSVVIGADAPTIVQTVLDVPESPRQQRKFRRWLFGRGPAKAPDIDI